MAFNLTTILNECDKYTPNEKSGKQQVVILCTFVVALHLYGFSM